MAHSKPTRVIPPGHRKEFRRVLRAIDRILPINWEDAGYVLERKVWPPVGEAFYVSAVNAATIEICRPFLPWLLVYGPPNDRSKNAGVFSFSILDERGCLSDHSHYCPIHLDVLADGRHFLKIYDLCLDSMGEHTGYKGMLWFHQLPLFKRPPLYHLIEELLISFPMIATADHSKMVQEQALADLHSSAILRAAVPSRN